VSPLGAAAETGIGAEAGCEEPLSALAPAAVRVIRALLRRLAKMSSAIRAAHRLIKAGRAIGIAAALQ